MESILACYPFLREIPSGDLGQLDLNALIIPTDEALIMIVQLSQQLNRNIVIYKIGYEVKGGHLCKYLKSAELTEVELRMLEECENKLGVTSAVVAYEKPLAFTSSAVKAASRIA